MATANKTWTWNTTAESWAYNASAYTTGLYDGTYGNAAGSLYCNITTAKNIPQNSSYWEISGTWESLFGIGSGSTVTNIQFISGDRRCTAYAGIINDNTIGPVELYDNTPTLQATLLAGYLYTGLSSAWDSMGSGTTQAVPSAIQASNTTVRLRITYSCNTGNDKNSTARVYFDNISITITYSGAAGPSASPSISPSVSPSISPSISVSISPSISRSVSPSASISPSISPSISVSISPSISPSISVSISPSISVSISPSISPSISVSISPSISPSISVSISPSISASVSPSVSISPSISPSISVSVSPSVSISPSISVSISPSISPSISQSASPSVAGSFSPSISPSISISISPSISVSISPSVSPSRSVSPSISPSISISISPSISPSISISISPSISKSVSPSVSISPSISPSISISVSPSVSPSISVSISPSISKSVSPSVSVSPSASPSVSPSVVGSFSPSISPSISISISPSVSVSISPSISISISPSISKSVSPSVSVSPSISPSVSPSVSPSGAASVGWIFPLNEISIDARVTKNGTWNDVDLGTNNDVPSGTKAIMLHIRNPYAAGREAAFRPNGASDDRYAYVPLSCQKYFYVKLDSSRIFEARVRDSNVLISIVGYTTDDYGFSASVDKSENITFGSYVNVDVSANVPTDAKCAWLEVFTSSALSFAIRRNGASDDYYWDNYSGGDLWFVGLDNDKIFQQKVESDAVDLYAWGYCKSEGALLDTYVNKTPGSINSWQPIDVSANVPSNAVGAIFHLATNYNGVYEVNLRKYGSTDDNTTGDGIGIRNNSQIVAVVGLDRDMKCECFTTNITNVTVTLIGYLTGPSAAIYSKGSYVSLPTDDSDLETAYTTQDYIDVSSDNAVRVAQQQDGPGEIIAHLFKDDATGKNGMTVLWNGQVTIACSDATVYLQVYNYNSTSWENIDYDDTTDANTDFDLTAEIPDLTNYKNANGFVCCRVYQ